MRSLLKMAGSCVSGEFLHDEALAAEEAGTQLFLEKDGQFYPLLRSEKGRLLYHYRVVRSYLYHPDIPGEAGGKGNHARAIFGGIDVLEDGLKIEN